MKETQGENKKCIFEIVTASFP